MKVILVIAGIDPSGGAGLLADVRVIADHGMRAVGLATATTVQDTTGVRSVDPVAPDTLSEALAVLLADVEVHAVKIGMLGDVRAAEVIARALAATAAPVVWDPVLLPSRGGVPLLVGDPREAARALLPEARVVTPNLDEAIVLARREARPGTFPTGEAGLPTVGGQPGDPEALARAIPAAAVLVKGGHAAGSRAVDVLRDGDQIHRLDGPRLDVGPLHGTGCVLSSALACGLAAGAPLLDAARAAKAYLTEKLARPITVGRGARCIV